jgi:intracellular sulfur oxidation DsrE/DsrF family protein
MSPDSASRAERRGFLGRLSASVLALGALPASLRAAESAPRALDALAVDEAWMDGLKGKYKQFFDCKAHQDGAVIGPVRNFLNAYRDAYGASDAEVSVVVGFHGGAAPMAFTDAAWQRFHFGQSIGLNDPATKMPALRNPAINAGALPADALIPALQKRGAIFLLCNNSLSRIVRGLAADGYGTEASVRAELVGPSLLPGVIVVPSMVVAANRLQMRGVTYVGT